MSTATILAAIGTVGILGAIYLTGIRRLEGWVLGIAASIVWVAWVVVTGRYEVMFFELACGVLYVKGLLAWRGSAPKASALEVAESDKTTYQAQMRGLLFEAAEVRERMHRLRYDHEHKRGHAGLCAYCDKEMR